MNDGWTLTKEPVLWSGTPVPTDEDPALYAELDDFAGMGWVLRRYDAVVSTRSEYADIHAWRHHLASAGIHPVDSPSWGDWVNYARSITEAIEQAETLFERPEHL